MLWNIPRVVLPVIGAFILGVYPGSHWLNDYFKHSRSYPAANLFMLQLLLPILGSFLGSTIYHLLRWSQPKQFDAALVLIIGIIFFVIGVVYCIITFAIPAGV